MAVKGRVDSEPRDRKESPGLVFTSGPREVGGAAETVTTWLCNIRSTLESLGPSICQTRRNWAIFVLFKFESLFLFLFFSYNYVGQMSLAGS